MRKALYFNFYLKSCPNGNNTKAAILKYCKPNGIPTIVIQKIIPVTANVRHCSHPNKIAHKTFKIVLPLLALTLTTCLPKDQKKNFPNLKYCKPIGIKTIVIQHNAPIS